MINIGKNLRQQRRGKGSQRYRSPGHRFLGRVDYNDLPEGNGVVHDLVHAPGRKGPLAVVSFTGRKELMLPSEGTFVGQNATANIKSLSEIPEGTKIFNIELQPGDGGRLCRSSGTFATLITKEQNKCLVLLPSNVKKILSSGCRATIGTSAASGRIEKPFMKAGNKHYAMQAANRYYPTVRGVAKNPLDHPFGGKTKPGKPKTVSRNMPPGKKVGNISASRSGRRKK